MFLKLEKSEEFASFKRVKLIEISLEVLKLSFVLSFKSMMNFICCQTRTNFKVLLFILLVIDFLLTDFKLVIISKFTD